MFVIIIMVTTTALEPELPTTMTYQEFKNKMVSVARLSPNDVDFEKILNELRYVKQVTSVPDGNNITTKNVNVDDALREANDEFRHYDHHPIDNPSNVTELANSLIYQHGWGIDDPDRSEDGDQENTAARRSDFSDLSEDEDVAHTPLDTSRDDWGELGPPPPQLIRQNADGDNASQNGGKAKRKSMKKTKKSKRKNKNKKSNTKAKKHTSKKKSNKKKRNTKTMRNRRPKKKN